jgi:hypothetical protein
VFLRETRRTNRDGSVVSYLQLAHNERHPVSGNPVAKVIAMAVTRDGVPVVTLATNAGQVAQRTATTPGQQTLLRALDLPEPPRFFDFTLPDSH